MIVMVVTGLLAAIAILLLHQKHPRRERGRLLKEDSLHDALRDRFWHNSDKQRPPVLRHPRPVRLPQIHAHRPHDQAPDTWMTAQDSTLMTWTRPESGINDVHSGSQQTGSDGSSYSTR
jgi:general secretion pathway protein G